MFITACSLSLLTIPPNVIRFRSAANGFQKILTEQRTPGRGSYAGITAACCCTGLRRSDDMGLSLGDTKASELLNDPNLKSMESKVRFGDFAQRTRENV